MFTGSAEPEMFEFGTTRDGVSEFMNKVPEGSTVVIESSTTGKTLSMMLSEKYEVHMIAPPERKPQVKTDKRDAVKIVMEDELGYARRVYVPSPYIEELRILVSRVIRGAWNKDLYCKEPGAFACGKEHAPVRIRRDF